MEGASAPGVRFVMDLEKRIEEALDNLEDSAIDSGRIATIPARSELRALARDVRRAALEEAARIAERHTCTGVTMDGPPAVATVIAQRVRALIDKKPT
jgi:hypothetical protein